MRKQLNRSISVGLIICLFFLQGFSKEKNDSINRSFKNTVKFNITNPALISDQFITIEYERVLRNNQSFSISLGKFSLPKFGLSFTDSLNLKKDYKDVGFHFAADYRFYLLQENRHNAPRGVYVGPYYTLNYLSRENQWELNTTNFNGNVISDLNVTINTIGFQLGYQFIFWDRLSLDLILLGPGVGFYGLKTKLKTTLTPDDELLFFEKLNELLADKIPDYDKVIEPGEFAKKGNFKTTSVGYRYLVNIGFRF